MDNQVFTVTLKAIGDFSNVKSNIESLQKGLTKLKLPDKLSNDLSKNFGDFYKEYDKLQQKLAQGIKTESDKNAIEKRLNSMLKTYDDIEKNLKKIPTNNYKDLFKLDLAPFDKAREKIEEIQKKLQSLNVDESGLKNYINSINEITKAETLFGSGKGFNKCWRSRKS